MNILNIIDTAKKDLKRSMKMRCSDDVLNKSYIVSNILSVYERKDLTDNQIQVLISFNEMLSSNIFNLRLRKLYNDEKVIQKEQLEIFIF